jgi:hypothetical protein
VDICPFFHLTYSTFSLVIHRCQINIHGFFLTNRSDDERRKRRKRKIAAEVVGLDDDTQFDLYNILTADLRKFESI